MIVAPTWESEYLTVEMLRLLNTAQKWTFDTTKRFASFEDWPACEGLTMIRNKPQAYARFGRVWPHIMSDGTLDLPGSVTWLRTNSDKSRYSVLISVQGVANFAFASCENGIILQGQPLQSWRDEYTSDPRILLRTVAR